MNTLTKEELIFSFRAKNTKRRDAIYNYYKDWFDLPLTGQMLAQRISADLGLPIKPSAIYQIRSKLQLGRKKPTRLAATQAGPAPTRLDKLDLPDLTDTRFQTSTIQFLTD